MSSPYATHWPQDLKLHGHELPSCQVAGGLPSRLRVHQPVLVCTLNHAHPSYTSTFHIYHGTVGNCSSGQTPSLCALCRLVTSLFLSLVLMVVVHAFCLRIFNIVLPSAGSLLRYLLQFCYNAYERRFIGSLFNRPSDIHSNGWT